MKIEAILQVRQSRIIAISMAGMVERALHLLKAENVGAVVVKDTCGTEGDVVLGILSERDIARALAEYGAATLQMPVDELMTRDVITCRPQDDTAYVIGLMQKHHIRHVPVFEREAIVGLVSIRDLLGVNQHRSGTPAETTPTP